ncbi:MAG: class I SAM-dependent methyltransferase [Anaerolineales bacterium]|nr:class I SAM-dependent methyltransferase [Anaerolineales bacterium]
MKTTDFNSYKTRYRNTIRQVLAQAESGRLDEAAFPAYSHRNPIINWLFWQRLRKVMEHIQRPTPYERVLDFGCGSGVMLPYLSQISSQVIALDVDLLPLERVQAYIPLASNVDVKDASKNNISDLPANSFDLIIALDVLEHVKDLPRTLNELLALLKQGGQLIVSGPTENILYRLGRKVAGPEYSGAYHERGIAEIKNELRHISRIEPIATLYWPIPLFEIFAAKKL